MSARLADLDALASVMALLGPVVHQMGRRDPGDFDLRGSRDEEKIATSTVRCKSENVTCAPSGKPHIYKENAGKVPGWLETSISAGYNPNKYNSVRISREWIAEKKRRFSLQSAEHNTL